MIRALLSFAVIFCLTIFLAVKPASAAEKATELSLLQNYLANLKTISGDFIQYNSDGSEAHGTVQLSRPGRINFLYEEPKDDRLVADGRLIHLWSEKDQSYSSMFISQTPASILLDPDFDLEKKLILISEERDDEKNRLSLTVARRDESGRSDGAGTLTLHFTTQPELFLKGWRIDDALGNSTLVALKNLTINQPIDNKVFRFVVPEELERLNER